MPKALLPSLVALKGNVGPYESLTDAQIVVEGGRERLRFSSAIGNFGEGPIELRGNTKRKPVKAFQHVRQSNGQSIPEEVGRFVRDDRPGHEHWHFRQLAFYRLTHKGRTVGTMQKQAFCLVDSARVRASNRSPNTKRYRESGCDGDSLRMGISVGWADVYPAELPGQYINLKGVKSGTYRLEFEINPRSGLKERKSPQRRTSVRIRIRTAADGTREAMVG